MLTRNFTYFIIYMYFNKFYQCVCYFLWPYTDLYRMLYIFLHADLYIFFFSDAFPKFLEIWRYFYNRWIHKIYSRSQTRVQIQAITSPMVWYLALPLNSTANRSYKSYGYSYKMGTTLCDPYLEPNIRMCLQACKTNTIKHIDFHIDCSLLKCLTSYLLYNWLQSSCTIFTWESSFRNEDFRKSAKFLGF